jgi:hypothetical protein
MLLSEDTIKRAAIPNRGRENLDPPATIRSLRNMNLSANGHCIRSSVGAAVYGFRD